MKLRPIRIVQYTKTIPDGRSFDDWFVAYQGPDGSRRTMSAKFGKTAKATFSTLISNSPHSYVDCYLRIPESTDAKETAVDAFFAPKQHKDQNSGKYVDIKTKDGYKIIQLVITNLTGVKLADSPFEWANAKKKPLGCDNIMDSDIDIRDRQKAGDLEDLPF